MNGVFVFLSSLRSRLLHLADLHVDLHHGVLLQGLAVRDAAFRGDAVDGGDPLGITRLGHDLHLLLQPPDVQLELLDRRDGVHQDGPLGPLVWPPCGSAPARNGLQRVPERRGVGERTGGGLPASVRNNFPKVLDQRIDSIPPGLLDNGVGLLRLVLVARPLLRGLQRRVLALPPRAAHSLRCARRQNGQPRDPLPGQNDLVIGHGVVGGGTGGGVQRGRRHGRGRAVPKVVVTRGEELREGASRGGRPAELHEALGAPAKLADRGAVLEQVRLGLDGPRGLGVVLLLRDTALLRVVQGGHVHVRRKSVEDVEEVPSGNLHAPAHHIPQATVQAAQTLHGVHRALVCRSVHSLELRFRCARHLLAKTFSGVFLQSQKKKREDDPLSLALALALSLSRARSVPRRVVSVWLPGLGCPSRYLWPGA
mmetsp:Transcript_2306/g.7114  ORF Transcript_2306/g.7114 Transcript_2306/m.7114 type:complete len:424 (+) Transcript_2306:1421-2692(+)